MDLLAIRCAYTDKDEYKIQIDGKPEGMPQKEYDLFLDASVCSLLLAIVARRAHENRDIADSEIDRLTGAMKRILYSDEVYGNLIDEGSEENG